MAQPSPARRNARTAAGLSVVAALMVGASFAAVPLYDLFCRATGFGGTVRRAEAAPSAPIGREVTVRFDANVSGLPWTFVPKTRDIRVRFGETAMMVYVARNVSDLPTAGTSTYNVTPDAAGQFFNKIECFCFVRQELKPGEEAELPVSFFVDPAMVEDSDGRVVSAITLSYTFHPADSGGQPVARRADDAGRARL